MAKGLPDWLCRRRFGGAAVKAGKTIIESTAIESARDTRVAPSVGCPPKRSFVDMDRLFPFFTVS